MDGPRSEPVTINWIDGHGREQTREVNQMVNAADFVGMAVYPWLIIAANPQLSAANLEFFLDEMSVKNPYCFRPATWIQKRRWMFKRHGMAYAPGVKPNGDGNAARAIRIMAEHPGLSLRDLTKLLKEHGINRFRDWVRRHRCGD